MRYLKDLEREYLAKLYELSNGTALECISNASLQEAVGISENQLGSIIQSLMRQGLATFAFGVSMITYEGIHKVEEQMEKKDSEIEGEILKAIYDTTKDGLGNMVAIDLLAARFEMPAFHMNTFINKLEKKGYIEGINEAVWIVEPGIRVIEEPRQNSHPVNFQQNVTHIHGHNYGGVQTGGAGNTQSIVINNNADLSEAISKISELVRTSSLDNADKDEYIRDLETVVKLTQDSTPNAIERAKAKFAYVDAALRATELAEKLLPYAPSIYAFFESVLKAN